METKEVTGEATICLKKDEKGYVHITMYKNEKGIEVEELTLRPEHVPTPPVNRTIVFLKEEALPILINSKIITNILKPKDLDVWCGFIDIHIFFELEGSVDGMYTRKL